MGWNNPPVRWGELERVLSGRPGLELPHRPRDEQHPGDGGDSPAWTRRRGRYQDPDPPDPDLSDPEERGSRVPYAELHCHSNFSFLDGASHPEELVEEAARLGLDAIAITDHDGLYGVVRFAEAARELDVKTVFGAELNLGLTAPRSGVPDPGGEHLLVLARGPEGYRRLSRTISDAHLRGREKGKPVYDLEQVAAAAGPSRSSARRTAPLRQPVSTTQCPPAAAATRSRS